jgi:O-antigen/teichoic acid export membrane protein
LLGIQYLDILNTLGMGTALVSRRDKIEETANITFFIGAFTGVLFFVAAWFIAPLLAVFFREEGLTNLFRLLALVLPIGGLAVVPDAMIRRSLRFKQKVIPEVLRSFTKGTTSIVLAYSGYGVWSLVLGQIAGEVVDLISLWWLAGWRPTLRFDWRVTRDSLSFGGHMISVDIVGMLLQNSDYLFIGRILGAAALGFYTIAYRIPELIIRNINHVVGGVAHPVLSSKQTDIRQLHLIYFSYIRYISLFTFPLAGGIAMVSPLFVIIFYTEKWSGAIVPMQLIAIALAITSVGYVPGIFYKAVSRPEVLSRISWFKLPLTLLVLWFCTRWGINGVAIGQVVLAVFGVALDSFVVNRVAGFRPVEMLQALTPSLTATLVMVIGVSLVNFLLAPTGIMGLILLVVTGIVFYAGALLVVSRDTVTLAYTVVRSSASRS